MKHLPTGFRDIKARIKITLRNLFNDGVYARPLGFFAGQKEIMVVADHHCTGSAGGPGYCDSAIVTGNIYLYVILRKGCCEFTC